MGVEIQTLSRAATMTSTLRLLVISIRAWEWIKNTFLFSVSALGTRHSALPSPFPRFSVSPFPRVSPSPSRDSARGSRLPVPVAIPLGFRLLPFVRSYPRTVVHPWPWTLDFDSPSLSLSLSVLGPRLAALGSLSLSLSAFARRLSAPRTRRFIHRFPVSPRRHLGTRLAALGSLSLSLSLSAFASCPLYVRTLVRFRVHASRFACSSAS